MKLTSRIECILLVISVWATNLLQFCHPEPYFSSNGNITPVKLINLNFRNRSSLTKHEGKVVGSAKISRIVPVKGVKNVKHIRSTKSELSKNNKAQTLSTTKKLKPNTIQGAEPSKIVPAPVFERSRPVSEDEDHKSKSTTSTNLPPVSSWDYLDTIKMDNELQRSISGLSEETLNNEINNITLTTQTDPTAEGNFFIQNVINDLSKMKSSRMMDVPEKKLGAGIRFSAKMKPVLNVKKPLRGSAKVSGKLPKVSSKDINQHSISGHISNNVLQPEVIDENIMKYSALERDSSEEYSSESLRKTYINSISTTPSLLHVLTVPEPGRFVSTTSTPFASSDSKRVFIPVLPVSEISTSQRDERKTSEGTHPPSARKPRGPPKDGEYSIPSITTTIGPVIPVSKGYQTIAELSTFGPKVIWYNHNQTPEDTFYPNSDDFLVPPEESIEILTDLSLKPVHDNLPTKHVSFIPSKVSVPLLKPSHNNKHGVSSNTPENDSNAPSHSRSNRGGSLFSDNRKPNNGVHLQHAAASDHNRIRDNDGSHDFSKFGGSRHGHHIHHTDSRPYATTSYKYSDIPIIPQHHEIIGSPSVDVGNQGAAYQVIDHYYDGNHKTNEIGPYHRNSGNYYEEAPTTRPRDGFNGNYKNSGPDHDREPPNKENSPNGWGQEYQGGGGGWSNQGPGHGWKGDEHTKFMDKAKDYFKNSDLSTVEKWFDISIGVFSFLAFGAYIIMLLYQVFTMSSGTSIAMLLGRSFKSAGEMFDIFFSKGPIGEAYMDEVETIVKRAMANVKRIWVTTSLTEKESLKVKGEEGAN